MANSAGQVARILYKEIVEGDFRKIHAKSNNSKSGGGARDFRFGSYPNIEPIVRQMFPNQRQEYRKRRGVNVLTTLHTGFFHWEDNGNYYSKESIFESPTDARRSEGRIAKVHEQPCLATHLIPQASTVNRVFVLLIQLVDESVWPYYAEERTLRIQGAWDPDVATQILGCIDARRPAKNAAVGFFDFTNATRYCNGS